MIIDIELNFNKSNIKNNLNNTIQKLLYNNILPVLKYINTNKLNKNKVLLNDNKIIETIWLRYNVKEIKDGKNKFISNNSLNNILNSIKNLITF